eukprot:gnl/MRDRNA2_/MRDRNA2_83765_c0_seq1.p1 gnl/MRDRNA2_/MRDRNA2_83765_c0~~gnl/MRDRNA2_/MRDRNA2_83765_c0_seq1.p1  ORF type:complete len:377 (-),score=63.35 gnl/MRDRNA2_/MRDRNA2_83765_c0_seq1:47-1021(-)
MYVAAAKGMYKEKGLDVLLVSPDAELPGGSKIGTRESTPARQVQAKQATFAVTPSESVVSSHTTDPGKPKLVAVAAIVQGSVSAICTLKSSGINRPAQLVGKRYASYGGRFEDRIVARLVQNDGGKGDVMFHTMEAHGYSDEETTKAGSVVGSYLEKGKSDSTWIFQFWEGVLAERSGQKLNFFSLEEYGVPYGYSPILVAHEEMVKDDPEVIRSFLDATSKGYLYAAEHPHEAAKILCETTGHPSLADVEFVAASQTAISPHYLRAGSWGFMEGARWEEFVDFLHQSEILTDRSGKLIPRDAVHSVSLFRNDFLPSKSNCCIC